MALTIKACHKTQTATLSNLNYYEQQVRHRITECDRMLRQKMQQTTFTKKVKRTKQMRPPLQKENKLQPERNHFTKREKIFVSANVPMSYRKQKLKMNAACTCYKNNILSKEADSKKTERAETTTRKRPLI